jgi:replicative DNA helicase Mcm
MIIMEEVNTDEVPTSAQIIHAIDEDERKKRRSALAYLMWHSGYVYTADNTTDSKMRAGIVDDMARSGMKRMEEMDIPVSEERMNALGSIRKQVDLSKKIDIPICYIDVEAITTNLLLPTRQPLDTTIVTPQAVREAGIVFDTYDDFRDAYNKLGGHIVTAPKSVLFWLQRFEKQFLNIADPRIEQRSKFHKIKPEWRFINPPAHTHRDFEALSKAGDVGRLVKIQGQVVEKGEVKTVLTHIAYRCVNNNQYDVECGTITLVEQDVERGDMLKPSECHICQGKKYIRLESHESKSEPIQRLSVQEEQVSADTRAIMVELRGDLCDTIEAGSSISIVGMMRLEPMTKNGLICSHYILASSAEERSHTKGSITLSKSDLEEVQAFEATMDLEEKMELVAESWAGHIHGNDEIKKAMILSVVGAVENVKFGLRPNMHMLIIGDPGTAKSKLLDLACDLARGSRKCDASSASAAGLTGACVQQQDLYTNQKRWAVLPGEIPLTPEGAVCAIDEFNLYKGDYGDVNLAMESGEVIISKVVKARLPVKCAIIAGANPDGKQSKRKKFNKMIPLAEQIELDHTLLQRFDMIFVILDIADKDKDEKIGYAMLKGLTEDDGSVSASTENTLELSFIHKLLEVAKTREAKLSKKATEYIVKEHAVKRSEAPDDESLRSHRQVASLSRFAIAAAKFDGVKTATLQHVKFAESLMATTLQEQDPAAIEGGLMKGDRETRTRLAEEFVKLIVADFMIDSRAFEEIYSELKKNWSDIPNMGVIEGVLKEFSRDSSLTSIHRSRNGVYTYNGTKNPAWKVW